MSELLLDSLEIKGYRCFEHLMIKKLGRVNLIVGKNNVGKTALLEALWIYAKRGRVDALLNILESRDELITGSNGTNGKLSRTVPTKENIFNIINLFYGRPKLVPQNHFLVEIKNIEKMKMPEAKFGLTLSGG